MVFVQRKHNFYIINYSTYISNSIQKIDFLVINLNLIFYIIIFSFLYFKHYFTKILYYILSKYYELNFRITKIAREKIVHNIIDDTNNLFIINNVKNEFIFSNN